jgi:hypothetical protein
MQCAHALKLRPVSRLARPTALLFFVVLFCCFVCVYVHTMFINLGSEHIVFVELCSLVAICMHSICCSCPTNHARRLQVGLTSLVAARLTITVMLRLEVFVCLHFTSPPMFIPAAKLVFAHEHSDPDASGFLFAREAVCVNSICARTNVGLAVHNASLAWCWPHICSFVIVVYCYVSHQRPFVIPIEINVGLVGFNSDGMPLLDASWHCSHTCDLFAIAILTPCPHPISTAFFFLRDTLDFFLTLLHYRWLQLQP